MVFNLTQARLCARLAQHAYSFDPGGLAELGQVTFVPVQDAHERPTSFAGVYLFPEATIVAFRGTMKSVPDWIRNFQGRLITSELGGRVHEGFYSEWCGVRERIEDLLREREAVRRPLYLTGHSQGGAIAVLAARHFERKGFLIGGACTFAAPRPGNAEFRDGVGAPVCRFEYGNDLIPHIPPPKMISQLLSGWAMWLAAKFANPLVQDLARLAKDAEGYVSVGRLTYLARSGKRYEELDETAEAGLIPERLWGLLRGADLVGDHAMSQYSGALERTGVA